MKHPVIQNQELVDKVVGRRGRLHAFEEVVAAKTCLVVIDMMNASIEVDPRCAEMIPGINRIASTLREAGGRVAWITAASDGVTEIDAAVFGAARANDFHAQAQPDDQRSLLHQELEVDPEDIQATKRGFSAFFPGRCDLQEQLENFDINSLLVCGTVTNVCVESSARDAMELGYRVVLIGDLCAGHAHGLHEASLSTFFRSFGDVRLASELEGMIED